jgi:uroporphyrinogen-III synthase
VVVNATPELAPQGLSVVVTRERLDAHSWVQALSDRGWLVRSVPLLALDDLAEHDLCIDPASWCSADALMFVSARAARVLGRAELGLGRALVQAWAQGQGPRVWAPGPGTATALREQGVPADQIDMPAEDAPQFDSTHLWAAVHEQVRCGTRVLLVRGEGAEQAGAGRDELRGHIQAAQGVVDEVAVYRRCAPQWTALELQAWQAAVADPKAVWLVSSSLALRHGHAESQSGLWPGCAQVLATHPRIAQTARTLGCTQVHECRPTLASVHAALQALSRSMDGKPPEQRIDLQ